MLGSLLNSSLVDRIIIIYFRMAAEPVSFYLVHGYVLWFIWTIFGMIQLMTNRYMKSYWKHNIWIHRMSGTTILVTTLIYAFYGYWKLKFVKDDVHAPMGLTVLFIVTPVAFTGIYARKSLAFGKTD